MIMYFIIWGKYIVSLKKPVVTKSVSIQYSIFEQCTVLLVFLSKQAFKVFGTNGSGQLLIFLWITYFFSLYLRQNLLKHLWDNLYQSCYCKIVVPKGCQILYQNVAIWNELRMSLFWNSKKLKEGACILFFPS